MVNHDKNLEGLHMTDQNNQSENNPSISGRVERIIPTSGEDVVQPLSADRIAAYLKAKDLVFNRDEDGDVFTNFDGNGFVLLATGEKREILVVRGAWQVTAPIEMRDRLVDLCNDWNRDKLWPKTYVTVDDAGAVRVRTELNIDMEYGASDLQLKQSLDCGIATSMSFFESLDKKFPDTRFAQ